MSVLPTQSFVVMKGAQVDRVFIGDNAEQACQARAAEIAAASFDDPQDIALSQATWIARAPVTFTDQLSSPAPQPSTVNP